MAQVKRYVWFCVPCVLRKVVKTQGEARQFAAYHNANRHNGIAIAGWETA